MKNIVIILSIFISYSSFAQNAEKMSITFENVSIKEALHQLERELTDVSFSYNNDLKVFKKKVNKSYASKSLKFILNDILEYEKLSHKVVGDNIIVYLIKDESTQNDVSSKKSTESNKKMISGYVYDVETGEVLIGVTIYSKETNQGTSSNSYGFFSLSLSNEATSVSISYLGYHTKEVQYSKAIDSKLNIYLTSSSHDLEEAVITATKYQKEQQYAGAVSISPKEIKKMPLLLGEPDVIKAIQIQNGVKTVSDGASFYYVRGGNHDQNLVLVDEAPLYNPSHILGLVSVINGDAIKNTSFYKGYFPAKYSGRLSSVLDITTNDGNKKKFHGRGGISTLGGRLLLEGPIAKDKASFMISGRKSWVDLLLKGNGEATPKYYDVNAKTHWKINENNNLYLSFYRGQDDIDAEATEFFTQWSNTLGSLRWNHLYSEKLFANTSVIYNSFNSLNFGEKQNKKWLNGIDEFRLKHQMSYFINDKNRIDVGGQIGNHAFTPGKFDDNSVNLGEKKLRTYSLFASHNINFSNQLRLEYGANFKMAQAFGKTNLIELDDDYTVTNTFENASGVYKTWKGVEPRVNLMYEINDNHKVFTSFSSMQQFVHSLNNSQNDYDVIKTWIPVSNNIDPMRSNIYSAGYNYIEKGLTINLEGFYKTINNQLDYTAYPQLQTTNYEASLRAGTGKSYGLELGLSYQFEKLKLDMDYSYSSTKLTAKGVNDNLSYVAPYDIPHQLTLKGFYEFNKRWSVSTLWRFSTGRPFTLPVGTQVLNGGADVVPLFGHKNNARGSNYHKLDIMVTRATGKPDKRWKGTWNFGLSNVYGKENPLLYVYDFNNQDIRSYNLNFFKFIPTLAYSFEF